jgi:putative inorganic carbon (HCO3(-)) transporter
MLIVPVTLWASAIPEKTTPQVLRLVVGIGLYYSIVNSTTSQSRLVKIFSLTPVLGMFLALFGLLNTIWILGKLPFFPEAIYSYLPKILEDTIHPNVLAGSLVLLLPMIIAVPVFAWHELKTPYKVYYLLASLLVILVLILTQSRGAFFALIAAFTMLVSLRWRNGWISITILILFSIIVLSAFGFSSVIDAPDIAGDSPEKLEGRIEIWSRGLYMVSDFPLTGIGMGLFSDIADALYPFFLNAADSVPHSHNLFLQVAIDLGIPGLISWLSILLMVFSISWWLFR